MSNTYPLNGRTYSFGTIPALEAVKVEVAIARVIGEPLFQAFTSPKKSEGVAEDAEKAGAAAIGMLLAKMDAKELTSTMETVFDYVSCDGSRVEINSTFTGRNRDLWQVFFAALKHNFGDFLPAGLLNSLRAKIQPASN